MTISFSYNSYSNNEKYYYQENKNDELCRENPRQKLDKIFRTV